MIDIEDAEEELTTNRCLDLFSLSRDIIEYGDEDPDDWDDSDFEEDL